MSRDVQVTWFGPQVKASVRAGTVEGVNAAAHRVQAVTVPRTPLDVGNLRSSIVVEPAQHGEAIPTASVGSDLVYAVPQHERLDYRHRDGRSKFLESALVDTADEVTRIIGAAISRAAGGGPA